MEKQTIGGFIAALRKANGLTQKQLAEKLNVSDKSVSRWERDECAPDLTLIPVIAEIFDITSDELLRGQRTATDAPPTKYEQQKTEKQVQNILRNALVQFQIRSTISIGIAIVGLIAAMICNFGFLRAYIGFGIGCIFYLSAIVCQVIFTLNAFSALTNDEIQSESINEIKEKLLSLTLWTMSGIAVLFAFTLPLMTEVWDAYLGLDSDAWMASGGIMAAVCVVICAFVGGIIKGKLANTGIIPQSENRKAILHLRMKWLLIATTACLLTISVSQAILPNLINPSDVVIGSVFDNWEDFKTCMESVAVSDNKTISAITIYPNKNEYMYTTENSHYYTNPLPPKDVVTSNTGTVLVEFYWINESICEIEYGDPQNDYLPVTAYSTSDIHTYNTIIENIQIIILLLMIPEMIACMLLYRKNKKYLVN